MKINNLLLLALLTGVIQARADTIINLYSGASTNGVNDANVTFLSGHGFGLAGFDFTDPTTFTNAMNGPSAFLAKNRPITYIPNGSISDNTNADWIGTTTDTLNSTPSSALYAITFVLPQVSAASLIMEYSVDNRLGTDSSNGLFINGVSVDIPFGGEFLTVNSYTNTDVTSYLQVGTNTLYLFDDNAGGPAPDTAALMFNANFAYTAVPEPSTYALFIVGMGALIVIVRRRKLPLPVRASI